MGTQYRVTCRRCGTEFEASEGGGFAFCLLHCERCGQEHAVQVQKIGGAFEGIDAWIAANVRPCCCGGRFTMEAKARCPKCRSGDWDERNSVAEVDYD